jgi:(1->4)-alpha-D-glucan 1-alpha-D-glucosylmutase
VPLETDITVAGSAIAFARAHAGDAVLVVAPRLCARLLSGDLRPPLGESWKTSRVLLPPPLASRSFRHELTGAEIRPTVAGGQAWLFLGEIFEHVPVGILRAV